MITNYLIIIYIEYILSGRGEGMGRNKKHKKGHVSLYQILAWNRTDFIRTVTIIIGYLSLFCTDYFENAGSIGRYIITCKLK